MTKSIMIQGAGSNVGKSLLVAGLCRAIARRGLSVLPFKPQNMSNNAAVTVDGGEIGRAQAFQALACGVDPIVDMNPVLLKPETDVGAQVVVHGKRLTTVKAKEYAKLKPKLMSAVLESFDRLKEKSDLVIVEGAGSPAEINLRDGDIANMGFAEAAGVHVVLVGDIDRGGVIAQMVGTSAVLAPNDLARIKGFMINKFRGDLSLFDDGLVEIENRTGWKSAGVIPWFNDAIKLPAEDASDIPKRSKGKGFKIVVPKLSRIANFDDLDPLSNDPNISVEIVSGGNPLPLDSDLVLIPGTKSTIGDLAYFRDQGWDIDLAAHIRRGGYVLGVCGGYQMLGKEIIDEAGIEGHEGRYDGLGYLDVVTHMTKEKSLTNVKGTSLAGTAFDGYEIHIGKTAGTDCKNAFMTIDGRLEGAASPDGKVLGCYVHGMFRADSYRQEFLEMLGATIGPSNYSHGIKKALDNLADHLEQYCDIDLLLEIAD